MTAYQVSFSLRIAVRSAENPGSAWVVDTHRNPFSACVTRHAKSEPAEAAVSRSFFVSPEPDVEDVIPEIESASNAVFRPSMISAFVAELSAVKSTDCSVVGAAGLVTLKL